MQLGLLSSLCCKFSTDSASESVFEHVPFCVMIYVKKVLKHCRFSACALFYYELN